MQIEQNVCEQEVIMGVLYKSLHTWQRKAASTAAKPDKGVESQSVESGTSSEAAIQASDSCLGIQKNRTEQVFFYMILLSKAQDNTRVATD